MSSWILVPCLVALRGEYDQVSPRRDKGADGSIGDAAHASSSDHSPDEDSIVLRARDSDNTNEVHALDIDSSGPWPSDGWFDASVKRLVERHRTGLDDRLQYVIWDGRIANRDVQGWAWRAYSGADRHTNHAHFSARYTTAAEADTSPWGVLTATLEEDTLSWSEDVITNPTWRADSKTNPTVKAGFALYDAWNQAHTAMEKATAAAQAAASANTKLDLLLAQVKLLSGKDFTDEPAIVAGILQGLNPAVIAAAIPRELAGQVADELAARMAA